MEIKKTILRAANFLLGTIVLGALCLVGIYSVYALWDNNRVYLAAENVQDEMLKLKPETKTEDDQGTADFTELLKINPDICAWVTIDNTHIDYPVLQGSTNHTYINRDVYGEFALAGSIFLDSRNDRGFTDTCSLLYGHYMQNNKMFGDLELFKDETFFEENRTGVLLLPEKTYELEIISCMLTGASTDIITDPTQWRDENIKNFWTYVEKNSTNIHEELLLELKTSKDSVKILALSTCSYEFTDARTIVLAYMKPCAQ